ncbi:MAG: type II toxin-antitoxin system HicB family antitoxin [Thermomicrobiales bacterium]
MNKDYPILIFWSDEDRTYIADVPDLKYCSAHGDTPQEALEEVQIALKAWLEVAQERGMPIPEPTSHPSMAQTA